MVIDMPKREHRPAPPSQGTRPLGHTISIRLSGAQFDAVQAVADRRGIPLATAARELVVEALSQYADASGVTLLEALEAERAQEAVQAKRLAHFFGTAAEA